MIILFIVTGSHTRRVHDLAMQKSVECNQPRQVKEKKRVDWKFIIQIVLTIIEIIASTF